MVDDPGQMSPLEVLPVGERSQHVDMPDPVHVQGREQLQVCLWSNTLPGYQAHPTLLVPAITIIIEVLMFGSYGAGDLDPKALNKLIGNQCLRPLYCTLGTGSCKP